MSKTFIFSGSGGQGIMSMGTMLAQAALDSGRHAIYMPSYGPEQRGGSAKCTVVVDEDEIISPLASKCDTLIVMNEQAYEKFAKTLRAGGILVANTSRIDSEIKKDSFTVVEVPADDLAVELGNIKCANIILIGALVGSEAGIISEEAILKSLDKKFASKKKEVLELNHKALQKGIEYGKKAISK